MLNLTSRGDCYLRLRVAAHQFPVPAVLSGSGWVRRLAGNRFSIQTRRPRLEFEFNPDHADLLNPQLDKHSALLTSDLPDLEQSNIVLLVMRRLDASP